MASTGIYISWKYFVKGFADYTDGVNVVLHEMAHALHHENFIKETGVDWDFRKDFEKLPAVFGPMMTQVIIQRKSYLGVTLLPISRNFGQLALNISLKTRRV